jgi:hypothetical protein
MQVRRVCVSVLRSQQQLTDALRVAMMLNDTEIATEIFTSSQDPCVILIFLSFAFSLTLLLLQCVSIALLVQFFKHFLNFLCCFNCSLEKKQMALMLASQQMFLTVDDDDLATLVNNE